MNREAWVIFFGLVVALGFGWLGNTAWKQRGELGRANARLQEMALLADQRAGKLTEAEQLLGETRERAEALARDMATVTNTQHRLENEMRAALESRDVAISELQGRLTVNILDRILFDSGEASLKPEGMKVLDQVAGVLAGFTNRQVQVFGHTDNVPIRQRFASNWELSTARALAAVRYLSEKARVDPHRLSAVGCGEYQPIADNSTTDGRSRNRRIALVVLPEQFVPSDVASTNASASTTNGTTATSSNPVNSIASPASPAPSETPEPTNAPSPSKAGVPSDAEIAPTPAPARERN